MIRFLVLRDRVIDEIKERMCREILNFGVFRHTKNNPSSKPVIFSFSMPSSLGKLILHQSINCLLNLLITSKIPTWNVVGKGD